MHNSLIAAIRDELAPLVRPRYFVDVESRTTLLSGAELDSAYEADVAVYADVSRKAGRRRGVAVLERTEVHPIEVVIPIDEVEIEETFLTIQELPGRKTVTVLKVLSPTNKKLKDERAAYLKKRRKLIQARVNFLEIDLLRGGEPMPLVDPPPPNDYRILICRTRPQRKAVVYAFPWTVPIPAIPIPLLPGDPEPILDLNSVLHSLIDRAGYDLVIDYRRPPRPPLRPEDKDRAATILGRAIGKAPK